MGWLSVEWTTVGTVLAFTARRLHSALFGEAGAVGVVVAVLAGLKIRLAVARARQRRARRRPVVSVPFTLPDHIVGLDRIDVELDPEHSSPN